MSPSALTWVPPQSSVECSPASSTRTTSPYLSPKNAMAPSDRASSIEVSKWRTSALVEQLAVREVLDPDELVVGDGREVGEVEAQTVGADPRALLLHVITQHLAKRPVEDVRRSVVPTDRSAALLVDRRGDLLADLQRWRILRDGVAVQPGQRVGGVEHLDDGAVVGLDRAGVTDLSAGLRVERGPVEEHGVADDTDDGGPTGQLVAAGELRRTVLGEDRALGVDVIAGRDSGALARGSRPFALFVHGTLEAVQVDLDATEVGHLLGDLEREPVGVVQLEGDIAGE